MQVLVRLTVPQTDRGTFSTAIRAPSSNHKPEPEFVEDSHKVLAGHRSAALAAGLLTPPDPAVCRHRLSTISIQMKSRREDLRKTAIGRRREVTLDVGQHANDVKR